MKLIDYLEQGVDTRSLLSQEEEAEGYSISIDAFNNISLLKEGEKIAWFSRLSDMETTRSLIRLISAGEENKFQDVKLR